MDLLGPDDIPNVSSRMDLAKMFSFSFEKKGVCFCYLDLFCYVVFMLFFVFCFVFNVFFFLKKKINWFRKMKIMMRIGFFLKKKYKNNFDIKLTCHKMGKLIVLCFFFKFFLGGICLFDLFCNEFFCVMFCSKINFIIFCFVNKNYDKN